MSKREEDLILPKTVSKKEAAEKEAIRKSFEERIKRISAEFKDGFDLIKDYPKSVSFFGSARTSEHEPYYEKVKELAQKISELDYAIITGGGLGLMEAANEGAFDAGGHSVGLNITLPQEQTLNEFTTEHQEFHYFFSRKMLLSFSAEAYIFLPGGFGTLDEFFEIITLIQTHKLPPVPVICFWSEFWEPLDAFIKEQLLKNFKTISPEDVNIYAISDDIDAIVEAVKKAPVRRGA